jgi:hypothetical protein
MATTTELDARLDTLETAFVQQEQNTVKVSELSDTQRRLFVDSIFPNGVAFHYLDPNAQVGDKVFVNQSDPLFPDFAAIGEIKELPIVDETDFNDLFKY